jgi:choline monooxygenase
MHGPDPSKYLEEETYKATRLPVALASTLIPEAYTEPAFFAIERERVFATSWQLVAVADVVSAPGELFVTEVGGESIIIARGHDGDLRGFYNVCRHRGTTLLDAGRQRVRHHIRCPYHSWAYDLDGSLLGTPLFTAESEIPEDQRGIFDMSDVERFDRADYGLHPARVQEWGPFVFATLHPDPDPLVTQLGDLPNRLAGYRMSEWKLALSRTYDIAANYKLIAENFMEYYHLPWVHPGLVKVSPMQSHYRWQGPGMYTGMCTHPIADNSSQGGWKGLAPMQGLSEQDASSARFVWLFPNAAVNVLPNHIFLMVTDPISVGQTVETTYLLVPRDFDEESDGGAAVEDLARFWDLVNREDIAIVERVQRGLASRSYTGGRMCYRFEEPLHRFQNMVIDRMVGIHRVPEGDATHERLMFGA